MQPAFHGSTGRTKRVVLTGFMGAGKSSVGRRLAPLLGWRFLDIDSMLCARADATVAELFASRGEGGFRALEAAEIAAALSKQHVVIALGGGALEHAETRALLAPTSPVAHDTLLIYLEVPLPVALARCASESGAAARPLLQDTSALERRFLARLPAYQSAHRTIPTARHSPQQIASMLAQSILQAS